jgi:hypothetical protein
MSFSLPFEQELVNKKLAALLPNSGGLGWMVDRVGAGEAGSGVGALAPPPILL